MGACNPGAWSLEVLSTDAAGNQSPDNLISNWTNILQPGISYARILTGPWGPTANKSAIFSLQASTSECESVFASQRCFSPCSDLDDPPLVDGWL